MTAPAKGVALRYLKKHPKDSARLLERLAAEDVATLLGEAPLESTAAIMRYLSPNFSAACLNRLTPEIGAGVIAATPMELAAGLLRRASTQARADLLNRLKAELREPLERALQHSDNTAGSLMDPSPFVLHEDVKVGDALDRLSSASGPLDAHVYVLDRSHQLVGQVTAGLLLRADRNSLVGESAEPTAPPVRAHAGVRLLIESHRPGNDLPVVDAQGVFEGVVRSETVERLVEELGRSSMGGHIAHPLLMFGEFYWMGLREVFGGLSSGTRTMPASPSQEGAANHADS